MTLDESRGSGFSYLITTGSFKSLDKKSFIIKQNLRHIIIMLCLLIFIFLAGIDTVAGSNLLATVLGLGETKIDPKILTHAMTVAGIVQGALLMFTPRLSLKMYGYNDDTVSMRFHAEGTGAAVLTVGITCLCLFILKLDTTQTIGFSSLVWSTEHVLMLSKKYPQKMGVSPMGQIFWLLISLLYVYACFTSAPYTQQLVWGGNSLFALHNVLVIIKPEIVSKIYGYKKTKWNDYQKDWWRSFGYENLCMCVFGLSLLAGVEAHKSLGVMSLVVVAHMAHTLSTSCSLGAVGSFLMYFWIVFHASSAANFISTEVAYAMVSIIVAVTALQITSAKFPQLVNFEFPQLASEELTK